MNAAVQDSSAALIATSSSNENAIDGSTFTVDYYALEGNDKKQTLTVHYGYIDDNGTYQINSLPAVMKNNLRRNQIQKTQNNIYFSTYAEEISYKKDGDQNEKLYAYCGATVFNTPDKGSFALGITSNNGKWNYDIDGNT